MENFVNNILEQTISEMNIIYTRFYVTLPRVFRKKLDVKTCQCNSYLCDSFVT